MKQYIAPLTGFIKDYVKGAGASGVAIGMSGGKDSYVAAALCARALGPKNVLGVVMPNGQMADIEIARRECKSLGIGCHEANISSLYSGVIDLASPILAKRRAQLSSVTTLNVPPRLRMTVLYALAGSLNCLVVNTSNLSEAMVGYTTKWGDNVGDIAPLLGFTKTEVCQLGLALGLEKELVLKAPADGLSGKTDEDSLGFSYDELDALIRSGEHGPNYQAIVKKHRGAAHKRGPLAFFDSKLANHLEGEK